MAKRHTSLDLSKICDALGNETRFQLVKAMRERSIATCCDRIELHENGVSVADVVAMAGLAQSTVSRHLAVLEDAGVVYKEKRDQWSCYFLNEAILGEFLAQMNALLLSSGGCGASRRE